MRVAVLVGVCVGSSWIISCGTGVTVLDGVIVRVKVGVLVLVRVAVLVLVLVLVTAGQQYFPFL